MASAKFLEEALSTDVDESAVNAIVGSLETQLVTSSSNSIQTVQGQTGAVQQNHVSSTISNGARATTLKHGVSSEDPMNIVINTDSNKTTELQNANAVVASVQTSTSAGTFINNVGLVQPTLANMNSKDVKVVYPTVSQSTINATNARVCYVNQPVNLPNGTLTQSSSDSKNSPKQTGQTLDQSKPTGTALVIKSGVNSSHTLTPMTTMTLTSSAPSGVTSVQGGLVAIAKPTNTVVTQSVGAQQAALPQQQIQTQQALVGGIPTNVQILNVNQIRPATTNQAGKTTMQQRVMISTPQILGTRQVQPGDGVRGTTRVMFGTQQIIGSRALQPQITLQALQGLQGQGHLLLKTENGQYQLLRVGVPPSAVSTGQQTPTSLANNINTFRVQTITNPSVATSNAVQTQVPPLTTTQGTTTAPAQPVQRGNVEQTKEKCRKFLANLLELSSREPKTVERSVRVLIQELVDGKVEAEVFCDRLERLLNASPQPCLIGFLKKSLPLLRQSMVNNEIVIDGIRPPPANVVYSTGTTQVVNTINTSGVTTPIVVATQAQQIRGQIQVATATPQMRLVTHQPATLRPGQQIPHRIITPMRMSTQVSGANKVTAIRTSTTVVRPTTQIVRTPSGSTVALRPGQNLGKTPFATRPTLVTQHFNSTNISKAPVFVKTPVSASNSKEKKSFSSSGFMGDDDINDVAAMGGVNLAEESQRILGSTEFVGTQIRSCKDDLFLHSGPLMRKFSQHVSKYNLEEPGSDVLALLSHAVQEMLKNYVEKLAVISEHRIDLNKADPRYEVTHDVRAQLKCLEEVDKAERKRHEEQERELLLRAAKSRSKPEDPEQAKLKAKAKEMQRAEMEEMRQREANVTALLAIGPRKKPRLDEGAAGVAVTPNSSSTTSIPLRPRVKRVTMRDLLLLMEQEKETCRSPLLYKSYFK